MTAERRLAKLEGALSPKAATLLWMHEAHEFGSLPAYVDWLIDQPISVAPLERGQRGPGPQPSRRCEANPGRWCMRLPTRPSVMPSSGSSSSSGSTASPRR